MIVDENLNDCSEELISDLEDTIDVLRKDKRNLRINCFILIVFCLISVIIATISIKTMDNQDKLLYDLNTQLEQDESMLSLEYSIGYWFINQPEQINDSILYVFLKDNNAWYPEILLKQAKLESGNYTSNVYKNTNNLYGMKKVGSRQTTQLNTTYNGYGCYTNWCESVLDRMLWDVNRFNNVKPTEEEYLEAMGIYSEDSNYIFKLK